MEQELPTTGKKTRRRVAGGGPRRQRRQGDVAARLLALRSRFGLTQEELANDAGLDRMIITHIERGWNQGQGGRTRQKLAVGFGLSLENMFAYLDGGLDIESAVNLSSRKPKEG